MIKEEIKQFSEDIQKMAKQLGITYLEQKYSEEAITEEAIVKEYEKALEDGIIAPIDQIEIPEGNEFFQISEDEQEEPEETEEELYYYIDNEDIERITQELGFEVYDNNTIQSIKDKFYQLWKDQKKDIDTNQIEEQCKIDNGISLKQFLFCEEYLKTGKIVDTCKNLGIGRTTAFDYLKKDEVKNYLKERRETIKSETNQLLESNFQKAMEGLSEMMEDETFKSDEVRIKAIDTFLKYYSRTIEKQ